MGCRCKERRQAIAAGMRAGLSGDRAGVVKAARFVGRTSREDAAKMAARLRLFGKGRR